MAKLSVVIPVYFNEANLLPLYEDLKAKLLDCAEFACELVFVDDGSGDGSWQVLQQLAEKDERIAICRLTRNFGSHAAVLCGLRRCTGDCAVFKSADLQEPTEMLHDMFESWRRGNNVVLAVRKQREDKSLFAALYYWMVQKTALPQMPGGGFDVALLDRKVIDVLQRMDEPNSAVTMQILWSGFRTDRVYYVRRQREIGKSRWTLKKKIRLVSDTLFGFTTLPVTLVSLIGAVSFAGSVIWAIVEAIAWGMGLIAVAGWTTLFIFSLFSFGLTMMTLGILGNYLWRAFDASRSRPLYIVEEEKGTKKEPARPPLNAGER